LYGGIILEDTKDQRNVEKHKVVTNSELNGEGYDSIKRTRTGLKRLKKKKYFAVAIGLIFIILFSAGALALMYTRDQHKILAGVTISGLSVGSLTQDEAKKVNG